MKNGRDLHKELEFICRATEGPWRITDKGGSIKSLAITSTAYDGIPMINICCAISPKRLADAQFIADAREGWPEAINRAIAAEAEVERLRKEVVVLTMANCKLIKISAYDGLGKPELIDGKCFGYAGNMDEPHIDCQNCKAFCMDEEE